jgi:hypothetical protein
MTSKRALKSIPNWVKRTDFFIQKNVLFAMISYIKMDFITAM